jgi:hypothetical protein
MGRSLPVMATERDGQVPCKQLVKSVQLPIGGGDEFFRRYSKTVPVRQSADGFCSQLNGGH